MVYEKQTYYFTFNAPEDEVKKGLLAMNNNNNNSNDGDDDSAPRFEDGDDDRADAPLSGRGKNKMPRAPSISSGPHNTVVQSLHDVDFNDEEPEDTRKHIGEIPVELQYEEVDLNDPLMDPLEWTVRKIVPIPKAYYWQTGNYDVSPRIKAWHRTVSAMASVARVGEKLGGSIVHATGLDASKYDYVTSTMTEEQWKEARKVAENRKQRRAEFEKQESLQQLDTELNGDEERTSSEGVV